VAQGFEALAQLGRSSACAGASRLAPPNNITPHNSRSDYLIISRRPNNKGVEFSRRAFPSYDEGGRAIVVDSNKWFKGGDVAREVDAGSPGSGGASPSLRRGQTLRAAENHAKQIQTHGLSCSSGADRR
jgi:hypothetical protein